MELSAYLKQFERLAVALSGGVDSALLLREAVSALGVERVLAVTVTSELTPAHEIRMAANVARLAGAEHAIVPISALDDPMIRENGPERCYYCKHRIFQAIREEAWMRGFDVIADGTNADDADDYRPGRRALAELDVVSPFAACGMGKAEIYALSHGMPTESLPAYACLATRIPMGTPITEEALLKIEAAEEALHRLGFRAVRVRCHGDAARIEVPPEQLEAVFAKREAIAGAVLESGFRYAALDLMGYRKGSMNGEAVHE